MLVAIPTSSCSFKVIARWKDVTQVFHVVSVEQGSVGVYFHDGAFEAVFIAGTVFVLEESGQSKNLPCGYA